MVGLAVSKPPKPPRNACASVLSRLPLLTVTPKYMRSGKFRSTACALGTAAGAFSAVTAVNAPTKNGSVELLFFKNEFALIYRLGNA